MSAVKAAPRWAVDDVVTLGSVRWAVRSIQGKRVQLEALNANAGIIWNTTTDLLPEKTVQL